MTDLVELPVHPLLTILSTNQSTRLSTIIVDNGPKRKRLNQHVDLVRNCRNCVTIFALPARYFAILTSAPAEGLPG